MKNLSDRYKIYLLTNKINGKIYIGQTTQTGNCYKNYFGSGTAIRAAIIKYGKKNFYKITLAICYNQNDANVLEKYFIKSYNTKSPNGYNISDGGTEDIIIMRKKLSMIMDGEQNPFYGKHHSDETKIKISVALKGKKISVEQKIKISKANKGMVPWNKGKKYLHTSVQKRKISEANKSRGMSLENKNKLSHRMKFNNPMSDPEIAKKANCFR